MKLRLPFFAKLWQRVKDTWNAKAPKVIEIPTGAVAIVVANGETFDRLVDGIADASFYTGIDYSQILNDPETEIIRN